MSDEQITIILERAGVDWTADVTATTDVEGDVDVLDGQHLAGDGPGTLLERIGQHLDAREAQRLTRVHGLEGAVPAAEEDRELYGDVARVLEVLEGAGGPVPNADLERLVGFPFVRLQLALDHAEADDVVELRRGEGWALKRPPSAL